MQPPARLRVLIQVGKLLDKASSLLVSELQTAMLFAAETWKWEMRQTNVRELDQHEIADN